MRRDRKQSSKQPTAPIKASACPARRTRRLLPVAAFFIGALTTLALIRLTSSTTAVKDSNDPSATTLADLFMMPADELARLDVAEVNLLCAQGLPGAESLDIPKTLATLDQWSQRVRAETDRYLSRLKDPATASHYGNSEAKYRAEMLVQVLQEDSGVRYHDGFDPMSETVPVFTSSKDCFLHGLVNDSNGGNCVSMPVIYVAVARRLGYPVKFVTSREHTFCRWEGLHHPNPAWRERFNFDAPGKGFSIDPDEFYLTWPKPSTSQQVEANQWLKSLSPSEELALFLLMRGHVLRDNSRFADAQVAYAVANQRWPQSHSIAFWLAKIVDTQFHLTEVATTSPPSAPAPRLTTVEIGAQRREVERMNSENRRLMESQPRAPGIPQSPSVNETPGHPSPYDPK